MDGAIEADQIGIETSVKESKAMTDNLVERLRDPRGFDWGDFCALTTEAADRIEALEKQHLEDWEALRQATNVTLERNEAQSWLDEINQHISTWPKEILEAAENSAAGHGFSGTKKDIRDRKDLHDPQALECLGCALDFIISQLAEKDKEIERLRHKVNDYIFAGGIIEGQRDALVKIVRRAIEYENDSSNDNVSREWFRDARSALSTASEDRE